MAAKAYTNPKTKLDLMLDQVKAGKREITFDVRDWKKPDVDRLIKTAEDRGLNAASDGKWVLVRDLRGAENPFYGDLDAETSMVPAWKYYDSKAARDADARLKEGEGKKVVLGYSVFGFKEGKGKKWRMRLADNRGNPSIYDFEAADRAGRERAAELKAQTGVSPKSIALPDIRKQFKVWWDNGGKEEAQPKDRAANQARFVRSFKFGTKWNPRDASEDMFESFHGEPPNETIEYTTEEHFHSNLAALGELVELKVKLVNGDKAVIGFDVNAEAEESNPKQKWLLPFRRGKRNYEDVGYLPYALQHDIGFGGNKLYRPVKYDNGQIISMGSALSEANYDSHSRKSAIDAVKYLAAGMGKQNPSNKKNPFWPFNSFTKTTIYHVGTGQKYTAQGTHKGYTVYKDNDAANFIVPKLDRESRFDTKKDAVKFIDAWAKAAKNPKNKGPFHSAGKLFSKVTKGAQKPMDDFLSASGKVGGYLDDQLGRALNPDNRGSGPTLLCSNEAGTQLFIVGGDQTIDLHSLGIKGSEADKELVYVGHVTHVTYHARKKFGKKPEEFDYVHKMGEEGGMTPILNYDRINKQLQLAGGTYKIDKPLIGTSPGIEN